MKKTIIFLLAVLLALTLAQRGETATYIDFGLSSSLPYDVTLDVSDQVPANEQIIAASLQIIAIDDFMPRSLFPFVADGSERANISFDGAEVIPNHPLNSGIGALTTFNWPLTGPEILPFVKDDGQLRLQVASAEGDFFVILSTLTVVTRVAQGTPLPASVLLLGSGLLGLGLLGWRRQS